MVLNYLISNVQKYSKFVRFLLIVKKSLSLPADDEVWDSCGEPKYC